MCYFLEVAICYFLAAFHFLIIIIYYLLVVRRMKH